MATRIRLRRGTAAEWAAAAPILAAGEVGVDLTSGELRVGDGITAWASLTPIGGVDPAAIEAAVEAYLTASPPAMGALTDLSDVTIGDSAEGDVLTLGPLGVWGPAAIPAPDLSGYALADHDHDGDYDPAGTAASLVAGLTIPDSPDDISAAPASGQAAVNALTAAASVTVPATHSMHTLTMTGDTTLVLSNPTAGHAFTLKLSGAFTPTFPASVTWAGGSAPTYDSGKVYVFATFDAGTSWIGSAL